MALQERLLRLGRERDVERPTRVGQPHHEHPQLDPDNGDGRVQLAEVDLRLRTRLDVGGYAAGVFFGKHPMSPTVSPKKSWEGFAGSVLACMVAGMLLVGSALEGAWWQGVLYGAGIAVTATLGDLGESIVKRDLGIKDMGTLLPGHGD